jgi:hypothetical protein
MFTFEVLKDKDDTILRDGETLTHKLMMRDSVTKSDVQIALEATQAVMARDVALLARNRRPGFYYADSMVDSGAEARAVARQATYDAYDKDVSTAWMGKAATATVNDSAAVDPRTQQYDAVAAKAAKEAAYSAYDATVEHAWRNK